MIQQIHAHSGVPKAGSHPLVDSPSYYVWPLCRMLRCSEVKAGTGLLMQAAGQVRTGQHWSVWTVQLLVVCLFRPGITLPGLFMPVPNQPSNWHGQVCHQQQSARHRFVNVRRLVTPPALCRVSHSPPGVQWLPYGLEGVSSRIQ